MSDQTNKQVYQFSSPNSSSKTSPKRTFAEVVSPVSTPTRKFANVSSSSKRKRHEKFQGSSKGISKFRKLSKPENTLHRQQFDACNSEVKAASFIETVETVTDKVIECNAWVNGEVVTTQIKSSESTLSSVRNDPTFRPVVVKSANDKLFAEMYKKFDKQSYDDHVASQKIINSLTQALNSIFDNCSKSINSATHVRESIKKSPAPVLDLGEMHKLCLNHKHESEVQTKKAAILADSMFENMSVVSKVLSDNKIPNSRPNVSSSSSGRRVHFDKIDHFEPQSSNNYLKAKSSNSTSIIPKSTKTVNISASSETLSNIEIELNNSFDTTTSFVDSAKKSRETAKMKESYNEFKRIKDFNNLDDFEVSDDSVTDISEPVLQKSQISEEAYEEIISQMTQAAMNDPKKYFNKKSFNNKK